MERKAIDRAVAAGIVGKLAMVDIECFATAVRELLTTECCSAHVELYEIMSESRLILKCTGCWRVLFDDYCGMVETV